MSAVRARAGRWVAGTLLVLVLALAGCGQGGADVPADGGGGGGERPEGSVTLLETRPQAVGEATVVAYNVGEGEAGVSVATGDGPAESATVRVGDAVDVAGRSFEVVTITPGGGSDGAPGSKSGEVVLAPQG